MKTESRKRREPTAAQKEAARIRREGIRLLCKKIAALPVDKRVMLAHSYGIRTVEGRELSPFNSCLLASQRDGVSIVGGFQQWKSSGRTVRKGSRALAIFIPCKGTKETDTPSVEETDSNGMRFIIGNVFDIADTDCAMEGPAGTPVIDLAPESAPLELPENCGDESPEEMPGGWCGPVTEDRRRTPRDPQPEFTWSAPEESDSTALIV